MGMCVALKDFTGNGEDFVRNQLVDGGLFRNEQTLISTRFLRPATKEEIDSAVMEDDDPAPAPPPKKKGGFKVRRAKRR